MTFHLLTRHAAYNEGVRQMKKRGRIYVVGFDDDRRSRKASMVRVTERNRAPVGIRTSNLLIRSQMLYPVELRAQIPNFQ
jgi:hypothetical protein